MKAPLLILTLLALAGCQKNGADGNEGPNGGGVVAQQAATLVSDIVTLVNNNSSDFPEVNLIDLEQASKRVRLIVREHTYANGSETDASNNGYDLIELNRARWAGITDEDRRLALIFHELLGCMGLEKGNYYISSRVLTPENRFDRLQTFYCTSPLSTSQCQVSLQYDHTQKALIVRDQGCGNFLNTINFFYKHSRRLFSYEKPCTEGQCMGHSAPNDRWVAISFLDGGSFFFEGFFFNGGQTQLVCRP